MKFIVQTKSLSTSTVAKKIKARNFFRQKKKTRTKPLINSN